MKLASYSSKSSQDSFRNMFQVFQPGSKCNSMSSIERCIWIFHNPNRSWKILKILRFYWGNGSTCLLNPAKIRSGTCSKCSSPVPGATRWALSNGVFGFSIPQTVRGKFPKYYRKGQTYPLNPAKIRSGTCSKCSSPVPGATRWAL